MDTPPQHAGNPRALQVRAAVARWMRIARADADNMSQIELARRSGLGINTIRRIESEERAITIDQLTAICDILGADAFALIAALHSHPSESESE